MQADAEIACARGEPLTTQRRISWKLVASLLTLGATVFFWIRSRHATDALLLVIPGGHLHVLATRPSGLTLALTPFLAVREAPITLHWLSGDNGQFADLQDTMDQVATSNLSRGGFGLQSAAIGATTDLRVVVVPYWVGLLLAEFAPMMATTRWLRRVLRRRRRLCVNCGFDLRASKEICPECGEAMDPPRENFWMLKRADRIAISFVLGAIAACAMGWVFWPRNARHSLPRYQLTPAEAALTDCTIDDLPLDRVKFKDALRLLSDRAGMRVVVYEPEEVKFEEDPQNTALAPDRLITTHLNRISLADAISVVLAQTNPSSAVSFEPAQNDIHVTHRSNLHHAELLTVFNISDINRQFGNVPVNTAAMQAASAPNAGGLFSQEGDSNSDLGELIEELLRREQNQDGSNDRIFILGDSVAAYGDWSYRQRVTSVLQRIRFAMTHSIPPAAPQGPAPDAQITHWDSALNANVSDNSRKTEAALDAPLADLEFNGQPLPEALKTLADRAHVRLVVDWKQSEAANVAQDKPVRLKLVHVTAREALRAVLDVVADLEPLAYEVDGEIVKVANVVDIGRSLRLYDVHDLPTAPQNGDDPLLKAIDMFADPSAYANQREDARARYGGILLLNHTYEGHRKVEALLRKMRESAKK